MNSASRPALRGISALLFLVLPLMLPASAHGGWQSFSNELGAYATPLGEDQAGNMWFSNFASVFRYDGVNWTTYTTADGLAGIPSVMFADRSGNLWFGTEQGVSRYDGVTWKTYTVDDGLLGNNVAAIAQDPAGNLWFGTEGSGVSRYDGTTWTHYTVFDALPSNYVDAILVDRVGNIWFGTGDCVHGNVWGAGVARFDGVRWTTYTTNDGLPDNNVCAILEDAAGSLWFETDGGLSRFDGVGFKTYPIVGGALQTVAAKDPQGDLWFHNGNVLARFDGVGWTTMDGAPILGGPIVADRWGNIWCGPNRFDRTGWKTFTTADGLPVDRVSAVMEDRSGALWFGTAAGASRYDGFGWRLYTTSDGLAENTVTAIHEDRSGALWFGGTRSVSRFDGTSWTSHTDSTLFPAAIHTIADDRTGSIWVGGSRTLARFDGATWMNYKGADTTVALGVSSIAEDDSGTLWFGTLGRGVARFDGVTWRRYRTADGLIHDAVTAIKKDQAGNLWFATALGGVGKFDGRNWTAYTAQSSFANIASTFGIAVDRSGAVWFGTGVGVSRFDGTNWRDYEASDGLVANEVLAVGQDRAGDPFFGTVHGMSRFVPDYVPPKTVFLNRPPARTGARNLSASFVAAFGEARGIKFSSRFDGGSWSPWSAAGSWVAEQVPDGIHTLEARSEDEYGNVDPYAPIISFEVDATPPSPSITYPAANQPVRGSVTIAGTTADARFRADTVLVRPSGGISWSPLAGSSVMVTNGALAAWDTATIPDGVYDLRVSVTDSLGLTGTALVSVIVDNDAPYANETTPALVPAASGGDVFTTNAETHLYFPPHAFAQDATVTVSAIPPGQVPTSLPSGANKVLDGYELACPPLGKPARFTMSYSGATVPPGILAVYRFVSGAGWERLGGTVEEGAKSISLVLSQPGRYALFVDQGVGSGGRTLSTIAFTPRVFAPRGGFADPEVGISFSLGRAAPVTVRVYSPSGRLIREVMAGETMKAGANLIAWDGKDRNGGFVVDGLYLVTVESMGQTQKKSLAVVR